MKLGLVAIICLGAGVLLGHYLIPQADPSASEQSAENGTAPSSLLDGVSDEVGTKEQKPVTEDVPQAATAKALLDTIKSANQARSQAQMYLAIERLDPKDLARLARESDLLARRDWRGWQVQRAILARWTEVAPMEALTYAKALKGSSRSNAIGAVFGQLASTNPGLAERQLASLTPRGVRRDALRAVAMSLADSNPQQGISVLERNGAPASDRAFNSIAEKWARRDPGRASQYAASLPPGRKRDRMVSGVADAWASTDPDGALDWARGLGDSRLRRDAVSSVIGSIAEEDPEKALGLVKGEPRHNQQNLKQRALAVWFENDHEAAMDWINARPNQAERMRLFYGSAYSLVWEDPEGAYELVKDLPPGEQKMDFLGNILSNWSWNDPQGGVEWLKTFPKDMQGRLLGRGSHWGLAQGDPEAFREILEDVAITDRNKRAFETLGRHYVDQDPSKALEWAQTIESPSARSDVMASLYGTWTYREPQLAAESALALDNEDQRHRALQRVASSWAYNDPEEAMKWAETLSGTARDKAIGSVIQATASEDPIKAASEFERLAGQGSAETELAQTAAAVAGTWTESDPQAAGDWANSLTSEKARKEAVGRVADQWSEYDPVGASEWISGLAYGPERDAAAGQLASNIRGTDPERAFAWASTIQDQHDRYKAIEQTIDTWKRSNEAAARQAIENSDLTAADQTKLLEKFDS